MPRPQRAPKRQRGLIGIKPRWSGGRWLWRASTKVAGRFYVGPLRSTQEQAHRDYWRLRDRKKAQPSSVVVLGEAIAAVIARATCGDLQRDALRNQALVLFSFFRKDAHVDDITAEDLNAFVEWVLGRAPNDDGVRIARPKDVNTVTEKYLPLLRRAFLVAAAPWPEGVVKLRKARRQMEFFTLDEIRALVRRILSWRNEAGEKARQARRHADLVATLALTGMRLGELARLRVDDVDWTRRVVIVKNAKDAGSERRIPIGQDLEPCLRRLIARARADGHLVGGMLAVSSVFRRWQGRLEEPRLNGRTLRHSFVTALLLTGADMATARDLAGHRSLDTLSRYTHAVSPIAAEAVSRLRLSPSHQKRAASSRNARAATSGTCASPRAAIRSTRLGTT